MTQKPESVTIGYRHQNMDDMGGPCPCADPGNYVAIEITELRVLIRCWCGRTKSGEFDSAEEREAFIRDHQ